MTDKRRKKNPHENNFELDALEEFESMMEYILEMISSNFKDEFSEPPHIYGFSIIKQNKNVDSDVIDEDFEDEFYDESTGLVCSKVRVIERKPLIDVIKTDDSIHILIEISDIKKEDMKLSATDLSIKFDIKKNDKVQTEYIKLPCKIDPKSAKASYKNGVFEIILTCKDSDEYIPFNID